MVEKMRRKAYVTCIFASILIIIIGILVKNTKISDSSISAVKSAKIIEVPLRPDRWSDLIAPPPETYFFWRGPKEAEIKFEADGTEGPIYRDYGTNQKYLQGFRFRGPAGMKVIVAIVSKN